MSRPNVDDVINYLSIKFNKIFCDREFVCCVIEDFGRILDNRDRACVLVFPTLGPIYLKALRYQARIFDLAVFNVTSASGKFKSLAVCLKDHLKKSNPLKEETMSETSLSKRKRPERQLYVPPAQRGSRLKQCDKKVRQDAVKNHHQDCQRSHKNKEEFSGDSNTQCSSDNESVLLTLSDVVNLYCFFKPFLCDFQNLPKNCYQHRNCQFKKLLNLKKLDSSFNYDYFIKFYDNFYLLSSINWKLNQFYNFKRTFNEHCKSYPIFEFNTNDVSVVEKKPSAILVNSDLSDFENSIATLQEFETSVYKIECDKVCDDQDYCILDLSLLELGHFFIITVEENEYFYECQEKHDVTLCCENVKKELETGKQTEKLSISAIKSEIEESTVEITNKTQQCEIAFEKSETNEIRKSSTDIVKNQINTNNKKRVSNNKHEQEKEIMRMTKEYINRKTRPIMKYVDDSNDTLKISEDDSVNNWEDLFDDNGQIQEKLLTEIVDKVGDDITIVKASEDYTAYTNKPPEDLEHVVELYNFPATLETHDLVQAFSDINSDAMYIKWVDDTHALLVLGSLTQAQKAMNMRNPLIKVRPMTAASAISMDVANKSDLKPAMKRPPTNLQTARRLITSHLGTKSKLTKEQIAKEKQDLKNAKEMKRLIKQNEKDAWEGNLRSSVN